MGCFDGFSCGENKKQRFKNRIQFRKWQEKHTSNRDLKYGLQADRTILCALHVCPSQANVTWNPKKKISNLCPQHQHLQLLTSVKLFSSLRCLKDVTMFVWKSFHFKKNCWSAISLSYYCILFLFPKIFPSSITIENVLFVCLCCNLLQEMSWLCFVVSETNNRKIFS